MKKLIISVALAVLVLVMASLPALAHLFEAYVDVNNTSGAAIPMQAVIVPLDVDWMDANGLDISLLSVNYGPSSYAWHMEGTDKVVYAVPLSVGHNAATISIGAGLWRGLVVGTGGYVTTLDDPAWEPGTSFKSEFTGYVSSTASDVGDPLITKAAAFRQYVGSTGYVSTAISGPESEYTLTEWQDSDYSLYGGARVGQRINSFPISTITKVTMFLHKTGLPVGNATLNIRKVSDDSVIGSMGTLDVSTLGAAATRVEFTTHVEVPAIQDIRLSLEYGGGGAGDYVNVTQHTAADHGTGLLTSYPAGGPWADTAAGDCAIGVYTGGIATAAVSGYTVVSSRYFANVLSNSMFNYVTGTTLDSWTSSPGGGVSRSSGSAKAGSYSMGITKAGGVTQYGYQTIAPVASYQGVTVTFGVWLKRVTAGVSLRAYLEDDTGYSYSSSVTDSTFTFVSVTKTVDGAATFLRAGVESAGADGLGLADEAVLAVGDATVLVNNDYNLNTYVGNVLVATGSHAEGAGGIDNNGNNWITYPDPYWVHYKHTVNSVLVGHYEPTDFLTANTVPDRAGAVQNGTVTWGANPGTVTASVFNNPNGPADAYDASGERPDLFPNTTNMDEISIPDGTAANLTTHPLYPMIDAVHHATGFNEIQVWQGLGIIVLGLLVLGAILIFRGHLFVAGFVGMAWIAFCYSQHVFPWGALAAGGVLVIATVLWPHQSQL